MRASAAEKACSASPSAGITTLLSSAALLARQLVAAARPSCTFENAVPHQRLQHRLEMPRRQAMARRQCFSRDWPSARVESDIADGGDSQGALARQQHNVPDEKRVPKLSRAALPVR